MMIVKNQLFWSIAEKLMQQENVEKGTMMGFPCLRYNGNFLRASITKPMISL